MVARACRPITRETEGWDIWNTSFLPARTLSGKTLKRPLPGHKEVQPVLNQTQGQNRTDSTLGNSGKEMNHQTNKVFCRYKLKTPRPSSRRLHGSLLGARISVRHGRHVSTRAKPSPKWNQKAGERGDKDSASICASRLLAVQRPWELTSEWGRDCKAEDWYHTAFGATQTIPRPWNWISADKPPQCPVLSFYLCSPLSAPSCSTPWNRLIFLL